MIASRVVFWINGVPEQSVIVIEGHPMTRAFDRPGRSPVRATNGMVATSHPLASSAALRVLQDGGNAVDAAIAAAATTCVVEPGQTGIGGDCFAILAEPDGTLHGLNASGRAARGARTAWYLEQGITNLFDHPAHCVTVPGAIRGWETILKRFGTMDFDRVLRDAIHHADDGFPIASRVAQGWARDSAKLVGNEGGLLNYLQAGEAPREGHLHRFPNLAKTLKAVAKHGSDAFYTGAVAAEIASTVQEHGGFLSEEDIAACTAEWVTPISTRYNGYDVHEIPPNGAGITALILFNLLNKVGTCSLNANSTERLHAEIECARLAYSVRDTCVGDPDTMTVTVDQLLSDTFASDLARNFDPQQRNAAITLPPIPSADTVYLSVVDRDRRAVSFINSLYESFGSGLVTRDSGIALQNRGACFFVEAGHPNTIDPGKRPLHTIIPAMVTRGGKVQYCYGVMGGSYQPLGQAHVLTNMIDHGMDPQEALDHPRVFWENRPDWQGSQLELEAGISDELAEGLRTRGHQTVPADLPHGGGQIVAIDHDAGVLTGASDPRKDGQAQGY